MTLLTDAKRFTVQEILSSGNGGFCNSEHSRAVQQLSAQQNKHELMELQYRLSQRTYV